MSTCQGPIRTLPHGDVFAGSHPGQPQTDSTIVARHPPHRERIKRIGVTDLSAAHNALRSVRFRPLRNAVTTTEKDRACQVLFRAIASISITCQHRGRSSLVCVKLPSYRIEFGP